VNAAVLMFSACLAGADPMPVVVPPPGYASPAQPAPVVVSPGYSSAGDSCGKATVCGDSGHKSCLMQNFKGKTHGGCCGKGVNLCDKGKSCAPKVECPKPQPVCCKVQPTCDTGKDKCCCWKPGAFLHKCKAKLCGICDKGGNDCCGGVATAATPGACGSAVVPPPPPPVTAPQPQLKEMPRKVGYNPIDRTDVVPVSPVLPFTPASNPKSLELGPTPF